MRDDHNQDAVPFTLEPLRPELSYRKELCKELLSPLSFTPPTTKAELKKRLQRLLGRSLGELAALAQVPVPTGLMGAKGFAGQLIELFLGANAKNLPVPDFMELGIELKTVSLSYDLTLKDSTFICMADLKAERFIPFQQSPLYHKLSSLLWVLVLAPSDLPLEQRPILGFCFYQPSPPELAQIEADYNEFNELICTGRSAQITGAMGTIIQLRPKALNSQVTTQVRDERGNFVATTPKGYYLRAEVTRKLIAQFLQEQGLSAAHLAQLAACFKGA